MEINLVSDTVTKPTYEMLQYMFNASGWRVQTRSTVIELEAKFSSYVWHGSSLVFLRNMANKRLKLHTQPGEQIIADKYAHVYLYEGGG
jgi:threonine aldolase